MKSLVGIVLAVLLTPAFSATVNWVDTTIYKKPAPLVIAEPTPGVAPTYYVDLTSGAGSTCSLAAPCATLTAVAGKTGTTGGPAVIYLKGSAYLTTASTTLYGSSGNPILILPWPNVTAVSTFTAQGGCGTANANLISGANFHDVIFDGGPSMQFMWKGSGCTGNQNGYTLMVLSNQITLYRVQINANSSGGPALGVATQSGTNTLNFLMANSELYGATNYYGVYIGGGTGCGAADTTFTNLAFKNNIFRQVDGRGIQVEPRANSSGFTATGNVFYHIGYNSSGTSSISFAVQVADACSGETANVLVANNLMWDLGGGAVGVFMTPSSAASFLVYNNTVYGYGGATPVSLNSHGVSCFSDGCLATVENNIISHQLNGGINAINRDSAFVESKNACETGIACGSTSVVMTPANTFAATTTGSLNYLQLKAAAPAIDAGLTLTAASPDYTGKTRPAGSAYDIGAFEFGSSGSAPSVPGNPR